MMRNIPNFIIKFYRKIELTFLRITRYFVKIKVVSGNGQYLLTATSNTMLPSFFLRLVLYRNRIYIKFLVSRSEKSFQKYGPHPMDYSSGVVCEPNLRTCTVIMQMEQDW